jgi:hypothetical protein
MNTLVRHSSHLDINQIELLTESIFTALAVTSPFESPLAKEQCALYPAARYQERPVYVRAPTDAHGIRFFRKPSRYIDFRGIGLPR